MKKFLLVFIAMACSMAVAIGQRTISGTVVNENGDPLIGANVVAKGTAVGTVTDVNGNYSLNVPAGATAIVVSYTGYNTAEVELGVSNTVDVSLESGVLLGETVVTALGVSREEKSLGYSVQQVNSEDITASRQTNVMDALSGRVAGMYVTRASGNAGAASRVVLRGPTTFNGNNQALIVVDGVIISNAELHTERSLAGVSNSNRAIDIDPSDIESVSVLKGGAASALYGAEGANGVLLITTKKGANTNGKIKVEFNSSVSFAEANKLPELQGKYAQGTVGGYRAPSTGQSGSWGPLVDTLYWDGATNNPFDKNGNIVGQSNAAAKTKFSPYDNYNLFQTGVTFNNNIAITGGSTLFNFKISAGNTNEEGITPLNTFDRTNFGASIGSNLLDNKLHLEANARYSNSQGRRIQQGSNTSGLMLGLLRTPISFDNSNGFGSDAVDHPEAIYQPDGRQRNYRGGGGYDNPFWVIVNNPFEDQVNRLIGSVSASYDFSKWFTLSTNLGTDNFTDNRLQSFEINSRSFPSGRIFDDTYIFRNIDWYVSASGSGRLSDNLSFDYTAGTNLFKEDWTNNYIQGDGFSFPGFPSLANASTISTNRSITSSRSFSIFGSASFGLKEMLYLNLTGRQDWLSTLIDPAKDLSLGDISVFYPSVSVGFVFSEVWDPSFLNFGKLRLSYAEIGAGAPGAYLTSTLFLVPPTSGTVNDLNDGWTNGIGFPFNGSITGFIKDNVLGAIGLKPSKSKELEAGLEMKILDNRVGLDLSVYKRNSVDQIVTVPIASSTGYQRATINSGELETKGLDFTLGITPVKTSNFSWDLGINFTTWKTEVLSIAEGVNQIYLDGFTGSSIYNLGPETINGKTVYYEYGQIYGGAWLRDANGNRVIDDDPNSDYYGYPLADPLQRKIGDPNPDFLLGINNSLNFGKLNFSFLFDIKSGGDMWNGTKGALTFFGMSKLTENRGSQTVFDGVKGHLDADGNLVTNGEKNDLSATLDQGWYQDNGGGFGVVAEDFIEDASYIRLRNLSLSYDFSDLIKNNKFVKGLSLTLSAYNLWLETDYTGIDPETSLVGSGSNGQGLDYFQGPNTRSYTVGLNLKF